jgi:chemotaxis protein histidine kinase CheA
MITRDDEIRRAMATLRADYAREVPEQLRALDQAIGQAVAGRWEKTLVRKAIAHAHMIHGTAGSYRFHALSEATGRLEDALLGIEAGWLPPEQAWPEIVRALGDAAKAVQNDE